MRPPQGDKCHALKLKASAKKALCILKEDAKAALGQTADPTKCSMKFADKFTLAEKVGGPDCPTTGDTAAIETRVDSAATGIVQALAGVRFIDNGDGTVTDTSTGLQWEKKDGAAGGANLADPHDVENGYSWSNISGSQTATDGTVFTDFLSRLNDCETPDVVNFFPTFAGHCDWRLPTIQELQTILLAPLPCGTNPCIDPIFGPTGTSETRYWSSTTDFGFTHAWQVDFFNGDVYSINKTVNLSVRAVRGGF